jgi:hypothetical protein
VLVSAFPDPEIFSNTMIVTRSLSLCAFTSSYRLALSHHREFGEGGTTFSSCTYFGGGGGRSDVVAHEERNRVQSIEYIA